MTNQYRSYYCLRQRSLTGAAISTLSALLADIASGVVVGAGCCDSSLNSKAAIHQYNFESCWPTALAEQLSFYTTSLSDGNGSTAAPLPQ
jgi:hypothetical protein